MNPDYFGWVGFVLFAVGSTAIAYKCRSGFLAMLAANAAYIVVGVMTDLPSLVVTSVFMAVLDLFGWYMWAPVKNLDVEIGF